MSISEYTKKKKKKKKRKRDDQDKGGMHSKRESIDEHRAYLEA